MLAAARGLGVLRRVWRGAGVCLPGTPVVSVWEHGYALEVLAHVAPGERAALMGSGLAFGRPALTRSPAFVARASSRVSPHRAIDQEGKEMSEGRKLNRPPRGSEHLSHATPRTRHFPCTAQIIHPSISMYVGPRFFAGPMGAMHNIAHRPQNMEEPPSPKKYGESKSKRPVSAPSAMLATLAPLGA